MKKIILIIIMSLFSCTKSIDNNYRLVVMIATDCGVKDTLTCTYTNENPINPDLIIRGMFNKNGRLIISGHNWSKTLAYNVSYYKVISNNKY